jgi:hypothetical protein
MILKSKFSAAVIFDLAVRLYDSKQMRFVKAAEERKIVRQIQASFDQAHQTNVHAIMAGL